MQLVSTVEQENSVEKIKLNQEVKLGDWSNTECSRRNFLLLCQKPQEMNFASLTRIVLELKRNFESEKAFLEDRNLNLTERVELLENEKSDLGDEIAKQSKEITDLKNANKDLKAFVAVLSDNVSNFNNEIDELSKKFANVSIASSKQIKFV